MVSLPRWVSDAPVLRKILRTSGAGIGLDVGSRSVKAVRITTKTEGHPRLDHPCVQSIPSDADASAKVEAIRRVLQEMDLRQTSLVTAVGGSGTVVRLTVLPRMTPQELRSAILFEADKYMPFKPEEVYLDAEVLGEAGPGRAEVLVAAARKDLVDEHLRMLSQAGLNPAAVDLETLALANALEIGAVRDRKGATAHAHVGAKGTIVNILQDGRLRFVREISLGGDSFSQAVAEGLRIDALEAERLKCEPAGREAEVAAVLRPAWEGWLAECKRSLDFYENQHGRPVEHLLLSGGSAVSESFRAWLQGSAGLNVEVWDPLQGLEAEAPPGIQPAVLGVAVGLAIRGAGG